MSEDPPRNVHDEPLTPCSLDPETGYERDGYCREVLADRGRHEICAVMTEAFLEYSAEQGNDLTTARPELNFPGLEPGDRWCVCVPRWLEAAADDVAPPIVPEATAKSVLSQVPRSTIESHARDVDADDPVPDPDDAANSDDAASGDSSSSGRDDSE